MTKPAQPMMDQVVNLSIPERLSLEARPPIPDDHVAHICQLIQMGQTCLAADHLLFPEMNGVLSRTVTGVIRRLNVLFSSAKPIQGESEEIWKGKVHLRQYAYEVLIELGLNFCGLESRWLREREKKECLEFIWNTLDEWENLEREEGETSVASAVIRKWLARMKKVQKGNSMVAKTASRIESGLDFQKNVAVALLKKAEVEIKGNIYTRMVKEKKCKFGNDYALGLRWLRHLGYEQVSTNPVLAARAYQDEPDLMAIFREELKRHPNFHEWSMAPSLHGEEITLFATLLALWDNLHVFRPIFFNLREMSGGGVVSFQLNPNIAHLVDESVRDVFKAFSLASENLSLYDRYLLAGYRAEVERGRPNIVIKVAATTPAARTITRTINRFGFGSNITVDYTVSQEATLILEEMEGMAGALRKGIQPTQLYMTNMGGRLESHLREVKLEELFQELKKKVGEQKAIEKVEHLSGVNGTKDKVAKTGIYQEKVVAATRFANQRTINEPACEALADVDSKQDLLDWEEAISRSGTFVARRVWSIFFSPRGRPRWAWYLRKKYGVTQAQAKLILDRIHYLPASKRKPFDTYWTLASKNMVHTEFPDHQENVRTLSEMPRFRLKEYESSISKTFPPQFLQRLRQIKDFCKAYDINPELAGIFKSAGIVGDFGKEGLKPEEWPEFGPVQKTLAEFKAAYDNFQKEIVTVVQESVAR
jgi:hypothetical protein